jgi:hypothetical protein
MPIPAAVNYFVSQQKSPSTDLVRQVHSVRCDFFRLTDCTAFGFRHIGQLESHLLYDPGEVKCRSGCLHLFRRAEESYLKKVRPREWFVIR